MAAGVKWPAVEAAAPKSYDDESNTDRVQELYARLINDGEADVLISPYGSGPTDAAAVIAEQGVTLIMIEHVMHATMKICDRLVALKRNLEQVFDLFSRLKERASQKAGTLSGGEQQMVAVGRGIMAAPKVLMIDELSLGLSPVLTIQLFQNLKQLKRTGLTILLVEQNVQMALAVSDHGYVLSEGRTKLEGTARQLASDQHVKSAYLGL